MHETLEINLRTVVKLYSMKRMLSMRRVKRMSSMRRVVWESPVEEGLREKEK